MNEPIVTVRMTKEQVEMVQHGLDRLYPADDPGDLSKMWRDTIYCEPGTEFDIVPPPPPKRHNTVRLTNEQAHTIQLVLDHFRDACGDIAFPILRDAWRAHVHRALCARAVDGEQFDITDRA